MSRDISRNVEISRAQAPIDPGQCAAAHQCNAASRMEDRADDYLHLPDAFGVRQPQPGKCPTCGMALLPEGTRFAFLRHMMSSPLHIAVTAAVMIIIVAVAMMMMR